MRTVHIREEDTNSRLNHMDLPIGASSLKERIGKLTAKKIELDIVKEEELRHQVRSGQAK